ncbi:MAG: trehalose-phosphatase [Firmicutes bacterium]|nr:trehalose-phosphatase [Alicyclobacillaceae bacterium]MCL6497065.1 trehalose-phosphatase [Bacillota bacterium]
MTVPAGAPALAGALRALAGRPRYWFFDIDGTLAEIRPTPDAVAVPRRRRQLLEALHCPPTSWVTLASGRGIQDIDRLFPEALPQGWSVIAGHGAVMRHRGHTERRIPPAIDAALAELAEDLGRLLPRFPGSRLEVKDGALALHWRLLAPEAVEPLTRALDTALAHYPGLRRCPAKMAWEVRPVPGPDKGEAIVTLLGREAGAEWADRLAVIMMGDDATDEEAFLALGEGALTVRVGPPSEPTFARFRLSHPAAVEAFLRRHLDEAVRSPRPV